MPGTLNSRGCNVGIGSAGAKEPAPKGLSANAMRQWVVQMVDARSYFRPPVLHPFQDGLFWREELLRRSAASRLKSGVRIIRAIYIPALKRGDSENHTHQNMRAIVRSETTSLQPSLREPALSS